VSKNLTTQSPPHTEPPATAFDNSCHVEASSCLPYTAGAYGAPVRTSPSENWLGCRVLRRRRPLSCVIVCHARAIEGNLTRSLPGLSFDTLRPKGRADTNEFPGFSVSLGNALRTKSRPVRVTPCRGDLLRIDGIRRDPMEHAEKLASTLGAEGPSHAVLGDRTRRHGDTRPQSPPQSGRRARTTSARQDRRTESHSEIEPVSGAAPEKFRTFEKRGLRLRPELRAGDADFGPVAVSRVRVRHPNPASY
jgi:hypothetical protein